MEEIVSHLVQDARHSLQILSSLWDEIGQELEQRNVVSREIEHELKRIFTAKIQDAQETKAQMHLRIRVSGVRIKTLRSQLDLDREEILEQEDHEGSVTAPIPLKQTLFQLDNTLQALDEMKSKRIAILNEKSEHLNKLIQNLEEPMDEETHEALQVNADGDLSAQREVPLDQRIEALEQTRSQRMSLISNLCDRMKATWELLGVEFQGSETEELDVQVRSE
jgi:hypothetical protein